MMQALHDMLCYIFIASVRISGHQIIAEGPQGAQEEGG